MKSMILPIKNMCGTLVGSGRVTVNKLGNYYIENINTGEFDLQNMNYLNDINGVRIHLGVWKINEHNKTLRSAQRSADSVVKRIAEF